VSDARCRTLSPGFTLQLVAQLLVVGIGVAGVVAGSRRPHRSRRRVAASGQLGHHRRRVAVRGPGLRRRAAAPRAPREIAQTHSCALDTSDSSEGLARAD
jgi:hypothetical protein